MKKWLSRIFYGVLFILTLFIFWLLVGQPAVPKGDGGGPAEEIADSMLRSVNKPAWDSLEWISWTFPGGHNYLWNKKDSEAIIQWKDYKVRLFIGSQWGEVWKSDNKITDYKKRSKLINTSWKYWCNDSFWLNPVVKIRDNGTERRIITKRDGSRALLVDYSSGGVTPGDAFLYTLDEQLKPSSWRMWARVLPVKGVRATFENWIELPGGSIISTKHRIGPVTIDITNVEAGDDLSESNWTDLIPPEPVVTPLPQNQQ